MKLSNYPVKSWFFTLLIFITCSVRGQNWTLVWADEFNGTIGPDWEFEIGTGNSGWGNNELQYYRKENATVVNGELVITARKESIGGKSYTSSRMITKGKAFWRFGKIEARIKVPSFTGSWPAFWMLGTNISSVGWPNCGEIDIMERVNTSDKIHGTVHWSDANGTYANYGGSKAFNSNEYHIYAVEWDTDYIRWFLDGVQYHEIYIGGGISGTSEFQNEFFILLNMAIGGNWPGFSIDDSALPAAMHVDYVRVYQDQLPTPGEQVSKQEAFSLYPNPTKDKIWIKPNLNEPAVLKIYNSLGQLLATKNVEGTTLISIPANWGRGVFIVELTGRQRDVMRLVIE